LKMILEYDKIQSKNIASSVLAAWERPIERLEL